MELSSIDYAKLISWLALHRSHVTLGRTQVQKILFICYGLYYAKNNRLLFDDDRAQAWPFGPVFPRSYKRYSTYVSTDLSDKEKEEFLKDRDTLFTITMLTDKLSFCTARELSEWSHQPDSPWSKAVLKDGKLKWSQELDPEDIKNFFTGEEWKIGLNRVN